MLSHLNEEQRIAVMEQGNTIINACPGSGKTRTLIYKVAFELEKLVSSKKFVIAMTFTNRAAEEIQRRIETLDLNTDRLWAGTLHSFCMEWILRPYSGYCTRTKNGFTIADEHFSNNLLNQLKDDAGIESFRSVNVRRDRNGVFKNANNRLQDVATEYHNYLNDNNLIDFDLIVYLWAPLLIPIFGSFIFPFVSFPEASRNKKVYAGGSLS